MSGGGGEALGLAGFSFFASRPTLSFAALPVWSRGRGLTVKKEAHMPSCTSTPEQNPLHKTTSGLLTELQKAERIICVMLNEMTTAQKLKVHAQLDAAGVSGDGITRYHERRAAIQAAQAMLAACAAMACGGAA